MPFYEYVCETCHEEFTVLRSMDERDRAIACPECGAKKASRKVSAFATSGGDTASLAGRSCGTSGFG